MLLQKNASLVHEYIKNCRSGVSFVTLGCSAGQILVQKFTKQFLQGNLAIPSGFVFSFSL